MTKIKFGHMDCLTPQCATRVVVRKNTENGTLSYSCPECDASGYAKEGEGQYSVWVKRIEPVTPAAAAPPKPPPEKPAPAPKPAPKPSTLLG